jgi:aminocarboxymuconate-semialdehyde decarboxylase
MGTERICLGSDYPFPLGEHEPGKLIETLPGITDGDRDRMLAGSALEFLGLQRSALAGTATMRA